MIVRKMLTCIACFTEVMIVTMCQSQQSRKSYPFILSSMMLVFAFSSFLVLIFSLHTNYLWLTTFLVLIILLATFTCTYSMPRMPDFSPESAVRVEPSRGNNYGQADDSPIWVIVDPPPTYESAVDEPPSYSKATAMDTLQSLNASSPVAPVPSSPAEPSSSLAGLDVLRILPESTSEVREQPFEPPLQDASKINR